jgi:YidC/Oxa1 family membrane protein insertase
MSPFALLDPAVRLAYAAVTSVSSVLPLPPGLAVLVGVGVLTVAARAALLPLALRGARADLARRAVAPQVERLRKRHRGDPAKLSSEVAAVYREAGTSQFAGFGAALLQLPVLSALYRVVVVPTVGGHPNAVLAANVWGVPLSAHWPAVLSSAGLFSGAGLVFVVLVAGLGGLAWLSSRQVAARTAAAVAANGTAPEAVPGAAAVARIGRLLPYGTVVFAAFAPLLVGAYLLVTTAWTVGERALLPRFA